MIKLVAPKGAVCSLRKLLVARRSSFAFDYSRNNFPEVANEFAALQQQSQRPRTLTSWFTITWPFTVDAIRNETVYIPVRRRWGKRRLQYRKQKKLETEIYGNEGVCRGTVGPSSRLEKKPTINSWNCHALCDSVLSCERKLKYGRFTTINISKYEHFTR